MKKLERAFLPKHFKLSNWTSIEVYFNLLMGVKLESDIDVLDWLKDVSELSAVLSEDLAWRYINTTRETDNIEYQDQYKEYVNEIYPQVAKAWDKLYTKLLKFKDAEKINDGQFKVYLRKIKAEKELFRPKNLKTISEIANLSQEYSRIMGSLAVIIRDDEYTAEEAQALLSEPDRQLREETYFALNEARAVQAAEVDILMNKLVAKRTSVALNAGFDSFLEYQFKALNRFDYTVDDCKILHESIKNQILPIVEEVYAKKGALLNIDTIRPWDIYVDSSGKPSLKPAKNVEELLSISKKVLKAIDPFFAEVITKMEALKHLDLDNRMGKAPGGYNYPLYESNVPYIFMNAVGYQSDLITFIHESGHAVHSVLSAKQELTGFKELGSEIAELASMSMELFSMEHWDLIYDTEEELKRAKRSHLEKIFMILPHIATIDSFQHWMYKNPAHSLEERREKWLNILAELSPKTINWFGLQKYKRQSWHAIPHIFTVPLYFVEYAIAQLGAIAMWKNYKENPKQTIANYKKALELGSSVTIPEVYEAAGVKFSFSEDYIAELAKFLYSEYQSLNE